MELQQPSSIEGADDDGSETPSRVALLPDFSTNKQSSFFPETSSGQDRTAGESPYPSVTPSGSSRIESTVVNSNEVIPEIEQGPSRDQRGRVYYLDWMRIISIYLVVSYHVAQALDWVGVWCGEQRQQDISFRCVALQLGMPLFFHISGRAQGLVKIKSLRKTVGVRAMRLLLPFLVCWAVLIPPWIWIHEKDNMEECMASKDSRNRTVYHTHVSPNPDVPQNLFVYLFKFWTFQDDLFKFDPAWLWFLPVLFMVTVCSMPVMLLGEYKKWIYLLPAFLWWLFQTLVIVVLNSGDSGSYEWTFPVFLAFGPFGTAMLVHFIPFPDLQASGAVLAVSRKSRFLAIRGCTALNVITSLGLVMGISYGKMSDEVLKVVPQMFMYPTFYLHGYFVQRWWPEKGGSKLYPRDLIQQSTEQVSIKVIELLLIMVLFLVIFMGSPVGDWEAHNWPIYSMTFKGGNNLYGPTYVLGTWAWLSLADTIFQAYAEDVVHTEFHKHASNSTIIVYIFHWVFIKIFCWYVVRDFAGGLFLDGMWKYLMTFLTWAGAISFSLCIYYGLLKCPMLGKIFGV